jgi:hypothetical protein
LKKRLQEKGEGEGRSTMTKNKIEDKKEIDRSVPANCARKNWEHGS